MVIFVYLLKSMHIPQFSAVSVSYMHIYVPIVILYGLRLFIVVLQEVQCLQCCLHVDIIIIIGIYLFTQSFVCLQLPVFEIAKCIT